MERRLGGVALGLLVCAAWTGVAVAQDATKKAEEAAQKADAAADKAEKAAEAANDAVKKIASSGDDFSGDRLTLRTTTPGFKLKRNGKGESTAVAGTKLRVMSDKDGTLVVKIDEVPCNLDKGKALVLSFATTSDEACKENVSTHVREGEAYEVLKKSVQDYGYRRSGWVYGALLLPYKYHRHDKSFSSATTVGPYLGYRLDGLGFDTSFVGSIGIASLPVQNASGDTSTLQGYTVALGIIGSVSKNNDPLQLGLMLGRDWAGSNATVPYKHEGKTWLAVQIGFSFGK